LKKGDELGWARLVSPSDHLVLVSKKGQAIRFKESDVRAMGRTATGVRAVNLKSNDELVGADVVLVKEKETDVLTISEKGYGKKTKIKEYRIQKRGGGGIKTARVTEKTGNLVAAKVLTPELEEIIAISKKGQILKTKLSEIPELGRQTQGVRIMSIRSGDGVASLTCF